MSLTQFIWLQTDDDIRCRKWRTGGRTDSFGQTDFGFSSVANRSSRSVNGQWYLICPKNVHVKYCIWPLASRCVDLMSNRSIASPTMPRGWWAYIPSAIRAQSKIDFYLSNVLREQKIVLFWAFKLDGLARITATAGNAAYIYIYDIDCDTRRHVCSVKFAMALARCAFNVG